MIYCTDNAAVPARGLAIAKDCHQRRITLVVTGNDTI